MIITAVRARMFEWKGPVVPPAEHFCTNAADLVRVGGDHMSTFRFHAWTVVEIETNQGLVGMGNVALAPHVAKLIIDLHLAPLIIGEDPFDTELLWQKMYRTTHAWGRKGVGMAAISAIDIALWDLKGKFLSQPVFKLLGGRTKKRIPCYASKLYAGPVDAMQQEAQAYLDQGFSAMKMRFGYGPCDGPEGIRRNIDSVAAVREVIGFDVDLMLECYMGWTFDYTRRILPKLERFEPRWLEEPLLADEIDSYAALARQTSIPIAGGEHEFTVHGFRQLLDRQAIGVIQYDTNRVGGITAALKINALAEAHGVPVIPHAGQMHNYHVAMASFASPMVEYFPPHDVEIGNELFYFLFDGEPLADRGTLDLADDIPGLGLILSEKYASSFHVVE